MGNFFLPIVIERNVEENYFAILIKNEKVVSDSDMILFQINNYS